jgi:membrane protease YdiL (CAAX protease family)
VPAWVPAVGLTFLLLVATLWLARRSSAILRETDEPIASDAGGPESRRLEPALTPSVLGANVALTQGLLVGLLAGGVVVFEIPWAAAGLGPAAFDRAVETAGLGLGLGGLLWLASEAAGRLADAAGLVYDERLRERLAPDSTAGWVGLFVVILPLVAVAEELLFRGAVIGVTAVGLSVSPWFLAGVSTVAFALGHGAQGRVGMAATGLLGAVLAVAFVLTGSLPVVILAHYVVNALEFAVHEAR